jgi:hypothetical protein
MQLMVNISYVYESCRRTALIVPNQNVPVKGDGFVLPVLQQAHHVVMNLSVSIHSLMSTAQEMGDWVVFLDKKYGEQLNWFGPPPYNLDAIDGKNLAKDSQRWMNELLKTYSESGTVTITEESIGKLLLPEFLGKLDPLTRDDIGDGVSCVLHLLPTLGAMILLRVAENAVRRYSEKLTGKPADSSWGDILNELDKTPRVKKSIIGYLHYLKDMRNEAQHPDKRFTQEEAERVLIQVKGLLEELGSQ